MSDRVCVCVNVRGEREEKTVKREEKESTSSRITIKQTTHRHTQNAKNDEVDSAMRKHSMLLRSIQHKLAIGGERTEARGSGGNDDSGRCN